MCPAWYSAEAILLVFDTGHPSVELAVCNNVSVVKGG